MTSVTTTVCVPAVAQNMGKEIAGHMELNVTTAVKRNHYTKMCRNTDYKHCSEDKQGGKSNRRNHKKEDSARVMTGATTDR